MAENVTNSVPRCIYEFESFRVDPARRRLFRDGCAVPLTSKSFDILLTLVENSGRTVEKDELMERVWADTFVEEGNLNRNISTLRKVLGDDGHEQRFIRTIPKHGYRFTAPVREVTAEDPGVLIGNKTSVRLNIWEEVLETEQKISNRFRLRAAAGVMLVVLAAFGSAWIWSRAGNNGSDVRAGVRGTKVPEAFEAYEKGRALWQTRSGQDLHQATLLLEQAVQLDPAFARAHSALADAYAFDFRNWKKAESVARESIRLDPSLGEPHATIGFVRLFWEWKFQEAESEFKEAIRLSPDYATAHQWYAINLFATGTAGNAALVEMKRALELEPDSLSISADMCQALYFLRRYDEAIEQCNRTLAADAKFYNALNYLYEIYSVNGMNDAAVETDLKIEEIAISPSSPGVRKKLREAYRTGGIRAFWHAKIDYLTGESPWHYRIAQYYARLGEKDKAYDHLRQAYQTRDFEFYLFLADPTFADLRTDQRYRDLEDLLVSPEG